MGEECCLQQPVLLNITLRVANVKKKIFDFVVIHIYSLCFPPLTVPVAPRLDRRGGGVVEKENPLKKTWHVCGGQNDTQKNKTPPKGVSPLGVALFSMRPARKEARSGVLNENRCGT
jgi:hypothetical protein